MNRFCWTLMAIGGLALVCAPTAGQNLLSNPSFEAGDAAPQGWHVLDGGVWSASSARTGRKCLAGKRPSKAVVWQSALVDLNPAQAGLAGARQSYRLSGWVKCRSGEAALVMEFLDDRGAFLGRAATPIAKPKRAWQFVAVEADAPQRASSARVSLAVEGEAYADDLVLAPLTANLLFNPGFEGDDRGRVGYWGDDPLLVLPGERVGAHRADTEQGRSGSALLVEAPQGWWPVRCVKIPVPTGLTQFRFAGWGRVAQGEAEILVEWIDDFETIVRVDKALATAVENGWTRFERVGMSAPSNAAYVTVTVVVRNGVARFDDFVLCAEAPASNKRPVVEVQVNQVGYEAEGPKTLVVQSNFLPKQPDEVTVRIINEDGARVAELRPACAGRINEGTRDDWGWYFWRADFSRLTQPGRYRALARVGEVERESPTFVLGSQVLTAETAKLALDFFFVQRCGYEVPGWHKACHLDDALLPDGTHIDATGGWHSAGDYNKLMYEYGDGGVVYALLAAYGAAPERWRRFDRDGDGVADVLDEAEWGARFVAKMQIPETGGLRNHVHQGPGREWMKWTAPEVHTDNLVGTPDDPVIQEGEGSSPLVIGGWARLSVLLNERGVQNDYLQRAVRLEPRHRGGGRPGQPAAPAQRDGTARGHGRGCLSGVGAAQRGGAARGAGARRAARGCLRRIRRGERRRAGGVCPSLSSRAAERQGAGGAQRLGLICREHGAQSLRPQQAAGWRAGVLLRTDLQPGAQLGTAAAGLGGAAHLAAHRRCAGPTLRRRPG